jgi:hypothetical protein
VASLEAFVFHDLNNEVYEFSTTKEEITILDATVAASQWTQIVFTYLHEYTRPKVVYLAG